MSSAGELVKELNDLAAFLKARASVPGDNQAKEKVSSNMIQAFAKKISNISAFTAQHALSLTTAVLSTELHDSHRELIQRAIDARLDGSVCNAPAQRQAAHTPQKLTSQLTNYLTAGDWASINSERMSLSGKTQVIVDRFQRLGLRYAHEQTVKWAVAILAMEVCKSSGSYPPYSNVLSMVHDFKATMESCRKPYPHGHITEYPTQPSALPPAVLTSAYDENDPPVEVAIDCLANTAENHVPLRSSSALLKKGTGVPPAGSSAMGSGMDHPLLQQMLAMLSAQASHSPITMLSPGRGGGSGSARVATSASPLQLQVQDHQQQRGEPRQTMLALTAPDEPSASPTAPHGVSPRPEDGLSPPSARSADPAMAFRPRARAPLALPPPAAVEDQGAEAAKAPGPSAAHDGVRADGDAAGQLGSSGVSRKPTQEYEDAALKSLMTRNEKRKASRRRGALDDDAEEHVAKRPAAAAVDAASLKKRPAASAGDSASIAKAVIVWTESDAHKPRDYFTSKMYHRSRKIALARGMAPEHASDVARATSSQAGKLYDTKTKSA